jgi:hypothetical protein
MRKKDIVEKWECSSGLVVDVRRELNGPIDTARTSLKAGESDDVQDGPDGKVFNFVRHRPITLEDARQWIRSSGDDPDLFHISLRTIAYGGDRSSNRMSAWPKTGKALVESLKLEQLYAAAERHTPARPTPSGDRGTVTALCDWQVGKTGRRGGTPELLQRLAESRERAALEYERRAPARILLADGGDGIENFESGGNPMFTNDLSLPDQLDCYATELFKWVELAARFAPVDVMVVSSNHSSWRRGKQVLGKPSDDFGIFVHKQVEKLAQRAGIDATWHYPDEWDESVCVDLLGTPIGLVHGSQFGPGGAIGWWEKQAFGSQAITRADILVTAHYHTYGAGVAGINPFSGRERMWLGAPTMDNGSDHYRHTAGRDSLPGTLIFDVAPSGFDISSLNII